MDEHLEILRQGLASEMEMQSTHYSLAGRFDSAAIYLCSDSEWLARPVNQLSVL